MRLLQHILLLLLSLCRAAWAQEAPMLTNVSNFDPDLPSFRSEICDRQRLLYTNLINLPQALQGLKLSVITTNYQRPHENLLFSLSEEGTIKGSDGEYPGLFVNILDELSRRAGFTWRNTYVVTSPLAENSNKTWTDLLDWQVDHFDISMEYWSRSTDRMSLGVSFPEHFYDSSIILVESQRSNGATRSLDIWSFLMPFEQSVWFFIFLSVVLSGMAYWLLEKLNNSHDERSLFDKPMATLFLSAIMFTGHFEFRPQTNAARILTFSWSFWSLIVMSAYTANLASFLVSKQGASISITTMEKAVAMGASICVLDGGYSEKYLRNKYSEANFVTKHFEDEVLKGVLDGDCDVAASSVATFQTYQRSKELNDDCALKWEGRVVQSLKGGLAVAVDTGTLCTSLISYVLDFHIMQMKTDGFLEEVWKQHLGAVGDSHCQAKQEQENSVGGDEETGQSLTMRDLGGIFIVHAVLALLSVSVAFFQLVFMKAQSPSHLIKKLTMHPDDWEEYSSVFKPSVDLTKRTINTLESELVAGSLKRRPSGAGVFRDDMSVASEGSARSMRSGRLSRRRGNSNRDDASIGSEKGTHRWRTRRRKDLSRMLPPDDGEWFDDSTEYRGKSTRSGPEYPVGMISFERDGEHTDEFWIDDSGPSYPKRTSSPIEQLETPSQRRFHHQATDSDTREARYEAGDRFQTVEADSWQSSNFAHSAGLEKQTSFRRPTLQRHRTSSSSGRMTSLSDLENSSKPQIIGSSTKRGRPTREGEQWEPLVKKISSETIVESDTVPSTDDSWSRAVPTTFERPAGQRPKKTMPYLHRSPSDRVRRTKARQGPKQFPGTTPHGQNRKQGQRYLIRANTERSLQLEPMVSNLEPKLTNSLPSIVYNFYSNEPKGEAARNQGSQCDEANAWPPLQQQPLCRNPNDLSF